MLFYSRRRFWQDDGAPGRLIPVGNQEAVVSGDISVSAPLTDSERHRNQTDHDDTHPGSHSLTLHKTYRNKRRKPSFDNVINRTQSIIV